MTRFSDDVLLFYRRPKLRVNFESIYTSILFTYLTYYRRRYLGPITQGSEANAPFRGAEGWSRGWTSNIESQQLLVLLPTFQHTLDYHSYAIGLKVLLTVRGTGVGPNALSHSSIQSSAFHYIPLSLSVHDVIFPKKKKNKTLQMSSASSSSEAC